ncbi:MULTISPECIES: UDP-2,3-diacylglucosamine diphosphatase [Rhodomicrobium]|uniref:UDP-2,3-diacylglucosamine diphosphatase n=1 Tax=Rhodomicrobium TaxID=1068 RepID=UPI0023EA4ED3|nr:MULTISPECIES: UDP-2,3-diacylglucosamine diphosphatase [Rhodomicrobium]
MRYRAIFLSDMHLAARACRSEDLLSFLKSHDAAVIFLVGDVIDFWRLRRGPSWRASQTEVIQQFLAKAQAGTRLVYIPGNHDEELRILAGTTLGTLEVRLRAIHDTADGRRFLVVHGDEFDDVVNKARWLAVLGDIAYDVASAVNVGVNVVRRAMGMSYWSLSAWLKYRAKRIFNGSKFEGLLTAEARRVGATGVICGHIHHACVRIIDGVQYVNTGDWVDSGTAVVEHFDGRLEIVRWTDQLRAIESKPSKTPVAPVTS